MKKCTCAFPCGGTEPGCPSAPTPAGLTETCVIAVLWNGRRFYYGGDAGPTFKLVRRAQAWRMPRVIALDRITVLKGMHADAEYVIESDIEQREKAAYAASPFRCGNALEFENCRHKGPVPAFRIRLCNADAPTFYACPCHDDSALKPRE